MTRRRRILLLAAAAVIIVVVGLLVALPLFLDVNAYRPTIEERASALLGRPITLGDLRLTLLPRPAVRVADIAVAALPGEGDEPLLTAGSLDIRLRVLPLLGGRLEMASLVLESPTLAVRRDEAGVWNLAALLAPAEADAAPQTGAAAQAGGGASVAIGRLLLSDGRITLRDAALSPGRVVDAELTGLEAEVMDLAPGRPLRFSLSGRLTPGSGAGARADAAGAPASAGKIALAGTVGPAGEGGSLPVDLTLGVGEVPAAILHPLLGFLPAAAQPGGEIGIEARLAGNLAGTLEASGSLRLGEARGDLAASSTAPFSRLSLAKVEAALGESSLALDGWLDFGGAQPEADIELRSGRLAVSDLLRLCELAGVALPVTLAGSEPLALEGRLTGSVSGETLPAISGRASVRGLTLTHPALARPIEGLTGTLALEGEELRLEEAALRLGRSDLAGSVRISMSTPPRVTFDLRSREAHVAELMSLATPTPAASASAAARPSAPGPPLTATPLPAFTAEGKLAVASGTIGTLDFKSLTTQMGLRGGTLSLGPLRLDLYGGSFAGSARADLAAQPVGFTVDSELTGVDAAALLADNLDLADTLSGSLTARLQVAGAGSDVESVMRGISGGGRIEVKDGRIGALDVLSTLSGATGLFGESTLNSLSSRLEKEGTEFSRLMGTFRLEGPALTSDDLLLESPSFSMGGEGTVDLLAATLDGRFRIVFAEDVSQSMRAEGSRAGSIFWDDRQGRVSLPLTLAGPLSAPTPGIQWDEAARQLVGRKAGEKVRGLLGGLFGDKRKEGPGAAPPGAGPAGPSTSAPAASAPAESRAAPSVASTPQPPAPAAGATATPPSAGSLTLAVHAPRWGGNLLAPDLRLSGTIAGRVASATIEVVDAAGKSVRGIESLVDVERHAAAGGAARAASVAWSHQVDGKRLVLAKSPYRVRIVAVDHAGARSTAEVEVKR